MKAIKQKASKAARDRAIGLIGPAHVQSLEAAGLVVVDRSTLEKLHSALSQLEAQRHG